MKYLFLFIFTACGSSKKEEIPEIPPSDSYEQEKEKYYKEHFDGQKERSDTPPQQPLGDQGHGDQHAPIANSGPSHGGKVHWGYEGQHGANHWGELDPKNELCANGREQSPVNLKWTSPIAGGKIDFKYQTQPLQVVNNGHTIQVNFAPGSFAVIRGHKYNLAQFHFHSQSEHTISNKYFPLEVHFVHKDDDGNLAVIGVMFKTGGANEALGKFFDKLPKTEGEEYKPLDTTLNPLELMPNKLTYYHYDGSLTTPPCSEGVNWNVMNTPLEVSIKQLAQFRKLFAGNYRPVQKLEKRKVVNY